MGDMTAERPSRQLNFFLFAVEEEFVAYHPLSFVFLIFSGCS